MSFDLRGKAVELLRDNPGKQFRARDIAQWIVETYPEDVDAKIGRSARSFTGAEVLNQLVAEIGAQRPEWERKLPQLRTTEGVRPRLFYWSDKSEEQEIEDVESPDKAQQPRLYTPPKATVLPETTREPLSVGPGLSEHDLYPMLTAFIETEYFAKGFRIDEKRSSNSRGPGGNKWLYPDVVGLEDLTRGMHEEVVTAIRASRDRQLRLWSFEVKLLINRANARETYFQAVSNSAWANFGYLAAAEFEGTDTLKELRILYAVHGIGLMRIDTENPAESEILIPARERPDIEWPMCSRLASENADFRIFMKRVRQFYQTGDV